MATEISITFSTAKSQHKNSHSPAFSDSNRRQAMTDSPFILNKHMIATSKVADARKMAQDANTVTGIAINAVGRGDIEIYEMASSAIKQIANPVEAFEDELGGAA